MSVLFLGPLPEPVTGHSLACQVFLDGLVTQTRVEVINLSKQEFKQGISSIARVWQVIGLVWRIWRKRNACDAIYFTTSESYAGNLKDIAIYLACFTRLSRMVIHLHGGAGMRRIMSRPGWWRGINHFFLRRLGGIVVLGPRHVDIFSSAVGREKIHIVPNFAEDYLFATDVAVEQKFRQAEPLRLLFLSNLLPGKGHDELLEAYRSLDDETRSRLAIDFAGGFESDEQRHEFVQKLQGLEGARYHGVVRGEQKRRLFADAHIFCLPTYYAYEGQPISILEAYASGCAVITTDHSGIFDIFRDGENGWSVPKASATALVSVIGRALSDRDVLRRIALHNVSVARIRYSAARYVDDLAAVLSEVGGIVPRLM